MRRCGLGDDDEFAQGLVEYIAERYVEGDIGCA
jgi:hypothetical protein